MRAFGLILGLNCDKNITEVKKLIIILSKKRKFYINGLVTKNFQSEPSILLIVFI